MLLWALLLGALLVFYLAYRFYARYLAKDFFNENDSNLTPAVTDEDGVDFVPTAKGVVFSHHFASIAGAGPIIGPTTAMLWGYLPVYVWIVLGAVFIGAVHDYSALILSVREKGKSVAEIAKGSLGKSGFFLFIAFTIAMIVLVTSAFLGLTATALSSLVPVKDLGLAQGQTLIHTTMVKGVENGIIGGISSTSVIVITLFSPLIGYLLYKRNIKPSLGALLAIIVCLLSIGIGLFYPVSIDPKVWQIILTVYVFIAAGIPVWLVLQPRDFTNSFILYGGIIFLLIGVFGAGFVGGDFQAPALNIAQGNKAGGLIWPFLFVTVACGAISGFHSLVAGGTVSKQIKKESHARTIGYGAMILEGILAVVVLLTVAKGINFDTYVNIVYPTVAGAKSNPILAFSLAMGGLLNQSLGLPVYLGTVFGILMVEGFVITTLDTAVRLNRYLFEELWGILFTNPPKILKSYYFNAGLSVIIMFYLSYTNKFSAIWPIFGAANQLLAALTLIAVTMWLATQGKKLGFTLLPAIFMVITTLFALYQLLMTKYVPTGNVALTITDILLFLLAIGVVILSFVKLRGVKKVE